MPRTELSKVLRPTLAEKECFKPGLKESVDSSFMTLIVLDQWLNYSTRGGGFIGARPEGPKLEPEWPRAEVGSRLPTTGFYGI